MVLPGLLAMLLTGTVGGVVRTTLISFALSLVINFYLTAALVALGGYGAQSIYPIFIVEIVVLCYLTRTAINKPLRTLIDSLAEKVEKHRRLLAGRRGRGERLLAIAAFAMLALFLFNYLSGIGSIFDHGDDVVSWNRWAVDWYNGLFPRQTWNYPQLLPANWSLSYVFLQDSRLQFFAKSISPVFSFFLLLACYDLWVRREDFTFLCAIPVTALLCLGLTGGTMNKGYADLPVTFMAFMSIYLLLASGNREAASNESKNIVLGAFCCAGAALTKQAGLFLVGLYPLLCYLLDQKNFRTGTKFGVARKVASLYLLLFILTAPWYLYTAAKIAAGREKSEIGYVTHDIYQGRSVLGRLADFLLKLNTKLDSTLGPLAISQELRHFAFLGLVAFLVAVCAALCYFALASFPDRLCRLLLILIVVPYFCLWAAFFSYDFRNMTLLFPFLGVAVGNGMYRRLRGAPDV
jgi:hypothetical protein